MKAKAQKRQIFDAVDLLIGEEPVGSSAGMGIKMIPVEAIRPFRAHPFHLYEGKRLQEMVKSVKEYGVLVPVIVQKVPGGYEMLAGHNRQAAARMAGLKEIPAVVKEGLTEKEAYVYVIETNMLQRSFSELSFSEKAAVLAERYDKVISQGKRSDIIRELKQIGNGTCGHDDHKLEDPASGSLVEQEGETCGRNDYRLETGAPGSIEVQGDGTCGHDDHKLESPTAGREGKQDAWDHDRPEGSGTSRFQTTGTKDEGESCDRDGRGFDTRSRERLGEDFGISGSSVKRLLRVNYLIPELKKKLDAGKLTLAAAEQLSYAAKNVQKAAAATGRAISKETAVQLRGEEMTAEKAAELLTVSGKKKTQSAFRTVRLPTVVYERYFGKADAGKAAKLIEEALAAWFEKDEAASV